eukprot:TRINITY_DN3010_c0_g1_i1.p1 TRINITY_DN3010_c0_g1~~TRINITY_DN3010_c0_g1_i1.p1  ORF type:complete len:114 (+),score=33.17 TRINITY_DN3010_c0_g1_i1:3-344(+)
MNLRNLNQSINQSMFRQPPFPSVNTTTKVSVTQSAIDRFWFPNPNVVEEDELEREERRQAEQMLSIRQYHSENGFIGQNSREPIQRKQKLDVSGHQSDSEGSDEEVDVTPDFD